MELKTAEFFDKCEHSMNLARDYLYKKLPGYACGYPPYPPGTAPPVGRKDSKIWFFNSVYLRHSVYQKSGINID